MKKIKFQKKLSLNKEVVVELTKSQMDQVKGGFTGIFYKLTKGGDVTLHCSYVSGPCSNMCD